MRYSPGFLGVILLVSASGCGESNWGRANGTVSLNGKPLSSGVVTFHPADNGPVATATIAPDGGFKAMTGAKEGLAVGEYKVTVVDQTIPKMGTNERAKILTPARYASTNTTDLSVSIKSGSNKMELLLQD